MREEQSLCKYRKIRVQQHDSSYRIFYEFQVISIYSKDDIGYEGIFNLGSRYTGNYMMAKIPVEAAFDVDNNIEVYSLREICDMNFSQLVNDPEFFQSLGLDNLLFEPSSNNRHHSAVKIQSRFRGYLSRSRSRSRSREEPPRKKFRGPITMPEMVNNKRKELPKMKDFILDSFINSFIRVWDVQWDPTVYQSKPPNRDKGFMWFDILQKMQFLPIKKAEGDYLVENGYYLIQQIFPSRDTTPSLSSNDTPSPPSVMIFPPPPPLQRRHTAGRRKRVVKALAGISRIRRNKRLQER